jgi:hypothetical protein
MLVSISSLPWDRIWRQIIALDKYMALIWERIDVYFYTDLHINDVTRSYHTALQIDD